MTTYQNFAPRKIKCITILYNFKKFNFCYTKMAGLCSSRNGQCHIQYSGTWDKSTLNTSCPLDSHLSRGWRYQPLEQSNSYGLGCARTSTDNILIVRFCQSYYNKTTKIVHLVEFDLASFSNPAKNRSVTNHSKSKVQFVIYQHRETTGKTLLSRAKNNCFSPEALYTCADSYFNCLPLPDLLQVRRHTDQKVSSLIVHVVWKAKNKGQAFAA